ncbi:MAG: hypothetical protein CMP93_04930 [Gammaproteobacteria bacterium]|nr:hypothetical protein [Gammaproteobacteria bacterium]
MSPNDHFILRKIISFFESNLLELLSGTSRSEATEAISNCMEYGLRLANAAELSEPLFSGELREVCESGALTIQEINISKWSKVSSALPDLRRNLFAFKKISSLPSYKPERLEPKSLSEITSSGNSEEHCANIYRMSNFRKPEAFGDHVWQSLCSELRELMNYGRDSNDQVLMELAWSNLNLLDRIVEGNVSWTFKSEKLVRSSCDLLVSRYVFDRWTPSEKEESRLLIDEADIQASGNFDS